MAITCEGDMKRYLGRLFGAGSVVGLSDGELLERFARRRDEAAEAAFEAILARHGAMVLSVCRQVVGDEHGAEDAFQATFLVLVRRAGSLRVREPGTLGPWLHGVAYRLALKTRQGAARRRAREHRAGVRGVGKAASDAESRELAALLHEEVQRLPAKYRAPLVICYFEGRTHDEAAAALQWPVGTVRGRLARARDLLRPRLARRGLAPGVWGVAPLLAPTVRIEPPAGLLEATRAAAFKGVPAAAVGAMTRAMLRNFFLARLGRAAALCSMALMMAGFGLVLRGEPAPKSSQSSDPAPAAVAQAPPIPVGRPVDPLPQYARARLGSGRFNHGQSINRVIYSHDGRSLVALDNSGGLRVWDAATGRLIRTIGGPSDLFREFAMSDDGRTPATIEDPGQLRVWELPSGRERRHWHAIPGSYQHLTFSPDGRTVAAGVVTSDAKTERQEQAILLWDVSSTTERRRRIAGDWRELSGLAFTSDGKTLVSGSDDTESQAVGQAPEKGSIRLWDVATGRERRRSSIAGSLVRSVVVSPDGRLVAAGISDGSTRIYDLETDREHAPRLNPATVAGLGPPPQTLIGSKPEPEVAVGAVEGNGTGMACLAFSPDGTILAAGSSGTGNTGSTEFAEVYLWEVARGTLLHHFPAHQGWIRSLSFSRDGRTLASAGSESVVRLTDVATGREVLAQPGHRSWIRTLAISPADAAIFTAGQDGTVRRWDPSSGRELGVIARFAAPPNTMAVTLDGRGLLIAGSFGAPVLLSTADGGELRRFAGFPQPAFIDSISLSPDGRTFACQATIRETASGKVLAQLRDEKGQPPPGIRTRFLYSPDGREVITVDGEGATVWDVATGKVVRRAVRAKVQDYHPALSPDGRLLATGSVEMDGPGGHRGPAGHLWEMASGREVAKLEGFDEATRDLAFSPDGRLLASGGGSSSSDRGDNTVRLWDVATGRELRRLEGHMAWINAIAFTPDGRSVVSAGEDATALIWDISDLAGRSGANAPFTAEGLEAHWKAMGGDDAHAAYRATWEMSVPSAVAFLGERLRAAISTDRVRALEASAPSPSPDMLRALRAIAALERVGTAEARTVLESLARGNPKNLATRDAKSALDRLSRSPKVRAASSLR